MEADGEGGERLGEVVGGRYELRGVLGRGGQSVIYRAKDRKGGDEVAIKVLRTGDRDGIDRLYREARALLALGGTAALRVLHQVEADDGAACLVTELLRGRDLTAYLEEIEGEGEGGPGKMTVPEIVQIFKPIVDTLEAARERGIVHRDIKPENIFVIHAAWGGGVRLLDFGFSRFVHARGFTQPGMVAGSPAYLSPELWRGVTDLDHRADVYALGVVLFRVLSGRLPFSGTLQELFKIVPSKQRPSLHALRPDLPKVIDDWVHHALAADREERFQRATALWRALVTCFDIGQVL